MDHNNIECVSGTVGEIFVDSEPHPKSNSEPNVMEDLSDDGLYVTSDRQLPSGRTGPLDSIQSRMGHSMCINGETWMKVGPGQKVVALEDDILRRAEAMYQCEELLGFKNCLHVYKCVKALKNEVSFHRAGAENFRDMETSLYDEMEMLTEKVDLLDAQKVLLEEKVKELTTNNDNAWRLIRILKKEGEQKENAKKRRRK